MDENCQYEAFLLASCSGMAETTRLMGKGSSVHYREPYIIKLIIWAAFILSVSRHRGDSIQKTFSS